MSSNDRSALVPRVLLLVLAPLALVLTGCGGPDLIERMTQPRWGCFGTVVIILDLVAIFDLLGDEARGSFRKVLWTLLIVFFPVGGFLLYFLFGRE